MVPAIWPERVSHHPCAHPMTTTQEWLPTPAAAIALVCSQSHLKRSRDSHGGPLRSGTEYRYQGGSSAPILWNIEACRDRFHHHGQLIRAGAAVLREVAE